VLAKLSVHLLTNGQCGYHRDELYYLASGNHPAAGYVDFPPITKLVARLDSVLLGNSWNVAMLLGQLGDVERMRGTHPRAAPLYQESIRLFQALGLREDPSRVHNHAYVALAEGQNALAASLFTEALRVFRRIGDQRARRRRVSDRSGLCRLC